MHNFIYTGLLVYIVMNVSGYVTMWKNANWWHHATGLLPVCVGLWKSPNIRQFGKQCTDIKSRMFFSRNMNVIGLLYVLLNKLISSYLQYRTCECQLRDCCRPRYDHSTSKCRIHRMFLLLASSVRHFVSTSRCSDVLFRSGINDECRPTYEQD